MESLDLILKEANRCLNCKKPLCREGCPVKTNIPQFINEIKKGDFTKSYEILLENNAMSYICSIVCPYEKYCTGNCIRGRSGEPVKIHELETFVNKWNIENNIDYKIATYKKTNKKVAVIGAGPAGLSCAIELAKKGFLVTIYEKEAEIGGLLTYGIPDFRLSKNILKESIEKIISNLEIKIKTNCKLGKDINIKDLEKEYEAVFLAIGTDDSTIYKLADKFCDRIYKANYFLKEYNEKRYINNLGKVIVIRWRKCGL